MPTLYTDSSYQAKVLLGVWQTGDAKRLRTELDRVISLKCEDFDSGEVERLELLSEIARELGSSNESPTADSSRVYCNLLEHLAYSGKQGRGPRPVTPPWGCGRAAKAAVLQ